MIHVIGFGEIIFFDGVVTNKEVEQLKNRMEENDEHFQNVQLDGRFISFEISGNKYIDYTELEKIKDELVKKKANVEIHVAEYMECDGTGFYYSSGGL